MKKYKPMSLRRGVTDIKGMGYILGCQLGEETFAVRAGPVPGDDDLLEIVGTNNDDYIVWIDIDGESHKKWRWNVEQESWISLKEEEINATS